MQRDPGPAGFLFGLADGELALAVRCPAPSGVLAGAPAQNLDLVGDHETRIEPDAELSDQRHVLIVFAGKLIDEGGRSRPRDGTQIIDQRVAVHADAVIIDDQQFLFGIDRNFDAEVGIVGCQIRLGYGEIPQPVARIRCVRDQFAQKNLFFAVKRIRDNLKNFANLSFKTECFFRHSD